MTEIRNIPSTLSAKSASLSHISKKDRDAPEPWTCFIRISPVQMLGFSQFTLPFSWERWRYTFGHPAADRTPLPFCDCKRYKNVELTTVGKYCLCCRNVVKSALHRRAQVHGAHRQHAENHTSHVFERITMRKTLTRREMPTNRMLVEQRQTWKQCPVKLAHRRRNTLS